MALWQYSNKILDWEETVVMCVLLKLTSALTVSDILELKLFITATRIIYQVS